MTLQFSGIICNKKACTTFMLQKETYNKLKSKTNKNKTKTKQKQKQKQKQNKKHEWKFKHTRKFNPRIGFIER